MSLLHLTPEKRHPPDGSAVTRLTHGAEDWSAPAPDDASAVDRPMGFIGCDPAWRSPS